MNQTWTFGQKLAAGLAVTVLLGLTIGAVSIFALKSVVEAKDRVIDVNIQLLVDAQRLQAARQQKSSALRGFLLTRDDRHLDELRQARQIFVDVTSRLKSNVDSAEGRDLADSITRAEAEHQQVTDEVIALRRTERPLEEMEQAFDAKVLPKADRLQQDIERFTARAERRLAEAKQAATDTSTSAISLVLLIAGAAVVFAGMVAFFMSRHLGRQLGAAVGQVQSSSAELQAAASQQAIGSKEQATATREITTTITELLATSRQIAESAQRVAHIASQTVTAARSGESTVERGHESVNGIRRQVDLIVNHMLELGKKSQQIGAVLDIVSELAEQTNILAINATIEAAGAGEGGKRFAVVAEEIRKLADRVTNSAKEVRALIEDVRSAVNTTVMTTESGSKAVDLGARQFAEVASAFSQIAAHVTTTTEAAKEIELSTKQQTTAVEQVNLAVANVAQAAKETEASSSQTLQTASQLSSLSRDILRLIQPGQAA
jgi:methyl-accepting chemotaxis protein